MQTNADTDNTGCTPSTYDVITNCNVVIVAYCRCDPTGPDD